MHTFTGRHTIPPRVSIAIRTNQHAGTARPESACPEPAEGVCPEPAEGVGSTINIHVGDAVAEPAEVGVTDGSNVGISVPVEPAEGVTVGVFVAGDGVPVAVPVAVAEPVEVGEGVKVAVTTGIVGTVGVGVGGSSRPHRIGKKTANKNKPMAPAIR